MPVWYYDNWIVVVCLACSTMASTLLWYVDILFLHRINIRDHFKLYLNNAIYDEQTFWCVSDKRFLKYQRQFTKYILQPHCCWKYIHQYTRTHARNTPLLSIRRRTLRVDLVCRYTLLGLFCRSQLLGLVCRYHLLGLVGSVVINIAPNQSLFCYCI